MTTRNELADLIESLSPEEFFQVSQISSYLAEKAGPGNPSGQLARGEGNVSRMMNEMPPRIRKTFAGMRGVDYPS